MFIFLTTILKYSAIRILKSLMIAALSAFLLDVICIFSLLIICFHAILSQINFAFPARGYLFWAFI